MIMLNCKYIILHICLALFSSCDILLKQFLPISFIILATVLNLTPPQEMKAGIRALEHPITFCKNIFEINSEEPSAMTPVSFVVTLLSMLSCFRVHVKINRYNSYAINFITFVLMILRTFYRPRHIMTLCLRLGYHFQGNTNSIFFEIVSHGKGICDAGSFIFFLFIQLLNSRV